MRVMFVARAVDRIAGGVERIISTLMNALATSGHEVDFLTWDLADAESFYPLMDRVKWHRLNLGDPRLPASPLLRLRRARAARALIKQRRPQVIVCFQDGPFVALRTYILGLGIPILMCERSSPNRFDHIAAVRYRGVIYQSFRFACRIVVQCESYKSLYPDFLQSLLVCIPNPVSAATRQARPEMPGTLGRYRLLSVGRLGYQKNYPVLIEAFSQIASDFPDWDMTIIGEGEGRTHLENLINTRGLAGRVVMPGTTQSLPEWYGSSHLFCLPSRWEGFPNALAESLAHGLPAVGFAECSGVRDLLSHGKTGLLAEGNGDPATLRATLGIAMSSGELRRSMGEAAIEGVKQFSPPQIFSRWEQLLLEVARG